MNSNKRFRTELFAGEGYRNAVEVMAHETFTLGNIDILETLSATILNGYPVMSKLCKISKELNEEGFVEDFSTKDQQALFQEVLNAVEDVTKKKIRYALWLTDKANVYRYALSGEDISNMNNFYSSSEVPATFTDYDEYDISQAVVLSDIGVDGILYGFEELPTPIQNTPHGDLIRRDAVYSFEKPVRKFRSNQMIIGKGFTMSATAVKHVKASDDLISRDDLLKKALDAASFLTAGPELLATAVSDIESIDGVSLNADDYTLEYCPFCDAEQVIHAVGVTACPECGKPLAPCSMCDDCHMDSCPYGCTGGTADEFKEVTTPAITAAEIAFGLEHL